jgi:nucleoside-diphosphate-sugar epimerase
MIRRVLLTGATGFVGRQILAGLQRRGAQVDVISRRETPDLPGVSRVTLTRDLFAEDTTFFQKCLEGIDTVVHAAWYVDPKDYVVSPRNLHCMSGTLRLAEAVATDGTPRFLGVGTCFEYDVTDGYLRTSGRLDPTTPYGAAKAATYLALSKSLPHFGTAFAWCRLFYLFGEGEDQRRLVPYIRSRLESGEAAELSSGKQVRDYLDVAEAGDRIAEVALSDVQGALNICSGDPVTVAEIASRIATEYGRPDLLKFGVRPDKSDDPPFIVGEPSPLDAAQRG